MEEKENKKNTAIAEKMETIQKLRHQNLLEYISGWYEEGKNTAILITELLQGGNLREHRKYQKKLKIKLIKKWIKQLLNALDYLHSNDYIHHDIKCQNILVDRISGNLKLGELFFIEKLDGREYFTKYIGTEEFMAPEVKEGKYTFKADIYSLGLTLLQLLTMEMPYKEYLRKDSIYEAKKKKKYPLSFNQIKNEEIKNFISLCLKDEKERPTCKELLKNKWLNNNESPDHNSTLEIINNLRQKNFILNKGLQCDNYQNSDSLSPFTSNNSLYNPNDCKICKQASMEPIYSLDISKLNSKKNNTKCGGYSFNYKKNTIMESVKGIKSNLSFLNLNEHKNKEKKSIFSERLDSQKIKRNKFKILQKKDSSDFLKNEEEQKYLTSIFLFIIELDYKLFLIFRENQEFDENMILCIKITFPSKKMKNKELFKGEIAFDYKFKEEKKNIEIIIENLGKYIELNKIDIELIKNTLKGKINRVMNEKKIKDLNDKINNVLRNFEFLVNNEEFDNLECLINSTQFNESKLPKEIINKLNIYKNKKNILEKIISSNNSNANEDYNNSIFVQEFIAINLLEIDKDN
jgi:serine/threonine protein kinase